MCFSALCKCCFSTNNVSKGVQQPLDSDNYDIAKLDTDDVSLYVAQLNFSPSKKTELKFLRGDEIEIFEDVDNEAAWYKGHNLRTKKTGLVPINYLAPKLESLMWYFPEMKASDAETALLWKGNEKGTFLVRPRDDSKCPFALSVRTEDTEGNPIIKHYRIFREGKNYYISSKLRVGSIHKLIQGYLLVDSESDLKLCVNITKPCARVDQQQYEMTADVSKQLEIKESDIEFDETILGTGNFATVYKGTWKNKPVAIKVPKLQTLPQEAFDKELKIANEMRHKNIVKLQGIYKTSDNCCIVLEFMDGGSLDKYIKSEEMTSAQRISVATQIASAMTYMEMKKVVHRDLAARNVLLKQNLTAKLADFGLSRFLCEKQVYTALEQTKCAIRWLAPECFQTNSFGTKSDVWAFALLLMELYNRGEIPFKDISLSNFQMTFRKHISDGNKMCRPSDMPSEIYDFLCKCWAIEPKERPTFMEIQNFLDTYALINDVNVN